jgi:hypothetical protein
VTGLHTIGGAALIAVLWLSAESVSPQALPPPRDGDIRVLHWELQNRTDVWLTLEPKTASGKPGPTLTLLTLNYSFPGKIPKARPEHVDLRAHPGMMWAPRIQLSLGIDEAPVELAPAGTFGMGDGGLDYVWVPVSVSTLRRMAAAKRVTLNVLGLEFELTDSQQKAVGAYLERILSDNPGQFKK